MHSCMKWCNDSCLATSEETTEKHIVEARALVQDFMHKNQDEQTTVAH